MATKFDYNKMLNVANKLLDKFGGTVMIETPDGTLYTGYGVFTELSETNRSGNLANKNDVGFLLSADIDYIPKLGDYLLSGTQVWMITDVEVLNPGSSLTLLYKMVVHL